MFRTILSRLSAERKDQLKRAAAVIPMHWRAGREHRRWRRFLCEAQWWPRERIEAWQLERLRHIVRHAFDNTEGYRELYRKAGVSPDDIRSLDDIRRLPFTTKQVFQDNLEAFSVGGRSRIYMTTGGSTGIPLGFYVRPENWYIETAFLQTAWSWAGWHLGRCSAVLRGAFIGSEERPWKYDAFARELLLSSYYLTDRTLDVYLQAISRYRPAYLQAYASSLNLLCDLLRESGKSIVPEFELILLGSENVYDWQLEKFEAAFPKAALHAWYGHSELAILAPWCERRRAYHVWPFYGLAEVLGEDDREVGEGNEGELVGTSFHSMATPFIRYRTMDRAVRGAARCDDCGRQFRLLDGIMGRSQEVIVTGTGRYISMTAINMHDRVFDALRQFQFLQEEQGSVVFRYVPRKPLSADEEDAIRRGLVAKLGGDVRLTLKAVDEIPRTPSGKYRFLDQRVPIRYGDRE